MLTPSLRCPVSITQFLPAPSFIVMRPFIKLLVRWKILAQIPQVDIVLRRFVFLRKNYLDLMQVEAFTPATYL
jgi:hypothetical protein